MHGECCEKKAPGTSSVLQFNVGWISPKSAKYSKLLSFCFLLTGCQFIGTIYNAGHKITSIVLDDRNLSDDWNDTALHVSIRNALLKKDFKYLLDIELTVFEGIVLLNGALPQTALIDEVVETVWQTKGVKQVYNYIRLGNPPPLSIVNEDAAISAKIRYELSLTKGVSSVQDNNGKWHHLSHGHF